MANQILEYLKLIRLNKPIGFLFLFIPCAYGILVGTDDINIIFKYLLVFFLGAVCMRSCGCIINDYFDRELDKKVERTKYRPIALGTVTIKEAFCLVMLLLSMSSYLLTYLPIRAIIMCCISIIPVIIYPLIKRMSYYPQIFLGFTFNLGLIIAFTTVSNKFNEYIFIPYLGFVCWTIFYDTLYGLQDIKDDYKAGVKSFALYLQHRNSIIYIHIFAVLFIILQMIGSMLLISYHSLYIYLNLIPTSMMIIFCYRINKYQYTQQLLAKTFEMQIYIGLMIILILIAMKS